MEEGINDYEASTLMTLSSEYITLLEFQEYSQISTEWEVNTFP
jgi:hypothetical protein